MSYTTFVISTSAKPEDVIVYVTSSEEKDVTLTSMAGAGIINTKNKIVDAGTF
jgi:hypothetical protein